MMAQSATPRRPRLKLFALLALLLLASACSLPTDSSQQGEQTVISGPPVVELVSPRANATYLEGITVNILATVSNAGADINRVDVTLDGAIIGSLPNPNTGGAPSFPLTMNWTASGVGEHTIAVTVYRGDGSASAPANAIITVVTQSDSGNSGGNSGIVVPTVAQVRPTADTSGQSVPSPAPPQPTQDNSAQTQPTIPSPQPAQPTQTQPPTAVPPSSTPNVPMAHIVTGANIRSGPGTVFVVIGSLAANEDTQILAVTPAGDWYKIRYYNGDGWIYAPLVSTSGNVSNLPVDQGPPPPTPTPVIPTNTPVPPSNVDLSGDLIVSPHPLVCSQASSITINVHNSGAGVSAGGSISIKAIRISDGQQLGSTETVFGAVQPNGTSTATAALTVSTYYGEGQRIIVTIDPGNQIAESNEGNNVMQTDYVLGKGSCP